MKRILLVLLVVSCITLSHAKEVFECPTKLYLGGITASAEHPLPNDTRLALLKDNFMWLKSAGLNSGIPENYAVLKPTNGDDENVENYYWDQLDAYDNHSEDSLYFVCSYGVNITVTKKITAPVSLCRVTYTESSIYNGKINALFECE